VSDAGFQFLQASAKRRDIGFEGSHSAVELAEGEADHRLHADHPEFGGNFLAKALEALRDGADLRSKPFGNDVEVPFDLVRGFAIYG
jgi:hypothetical protein